MAEQDAPPFNVVPLGPRLAAPQERLEPGLPRPLAKPAAKPGGPKAKPNATPMRTVLGAGGLAAFSAIATAIVLPPAMPAGGYSAPAADQSQAGTTAVPQPVRYVQLQPGQTAPPGAKVIDAAAPQPTTVVNIVPAPVQKPVIIKTTQSGKVVK